MPRWQFTGQSVRSCELHRYRRRIEKREERRESGRGTSTKDITSKRITTRRPSCQGPHSGLISTHSHFTIHFTPKTRIQDGRMLWTHTMRNITEIIVSLCCWSVKRCYLPHTRRVRFHLSPLLKCGVLRGAYLDWGHETDPVSEPILTFRYITEIDHYYPIIFSFLAFRHLDISDDHPNRIAGKGKG